MVIVEVIITLIEKFNFILSNLFYFYFQRWSLQLISNKDKNLINSELGAKLIHTNYDT
jgi:hypothetical protein